MQSLHADAPLPQNALSCGEIAGSLVPELRLDDRDRETGCAAAPQVQPLGPQHEADLLALYLGLDQPSRLSRFGYQPTDASLIEYARRLVSTADFIAGVIMDGRLCAVVEAFDYDGFSELAFVVHQDQRRHGLGSALLAAAKRWAEQTNRTKLRMVIARGNWPMRKLAERIGAHLDLSLDEIHADIAVSTSLSKAA